MAKFRGKQQTAPVDLSCTAGIMLCEAATLDDWSNVKPFTNMSPNPIENRSLAGCEVSRLKGSLWPDFVFLSNPSEPQIKP